MSGIYFVGLIKQGHSGIPVAYLRGVFNADSSRGDANTMHIGDGPNRIFVNAWIEPGWKNGKLPKKAAKVFTLNIHRVASVAPWTNTITYFDGAGLVHQGSITCLATRGTKWPNAGNRQSTWRRYMQSVWR